jgi:hypothetical protein
LLTIRIDGEFEKNMETRFVASMVLAGVGDAMVRIHTFIVLLLIIQIFSRVITMEGGNLIIQV